MIRPPGHVILSPPECYAFSMSVATRRAVIQGVFALCEFPIWGLHAGILYLRPPGQSSRYLVRIPLTARLTANETILKGSIAMHGIRADQRAVGCGIRNRVVPRSSAQLGDWPGARSRWWTRDAPYVRLAQQSIHTCRGPHLRVELRQNTSIVRAPASDTSVVLVAGRAA
jgi:hypothetical protein